MTEPNLAKKRNMGSPCVRGAEGTLQDMNKRAEISARKLIGETWCLKEEAQGPCPPELENIFMFDDLVELNEAQSELNSEAEMWEITALRKSLKTRSSKKKQQGLGMGPGWSCWAL